MDFQTLSAKPQKIFNLFQGTVLSPEVENPQANAADCNIHSPEDHKSAASVR